MGELFWGIAPKICKAFEASVNRKMSEGRSFADALMFGEPSPKPFRSFIIALHRYNSNICGCYWWSACGRSVEFFGMIDWMEVERYEWISQ
jgi:hypothetical protein